VETGRFVLWILEIIILWAALFAVQIPFRRKEWPPLRMIVFLVKVALFPGTALLFVSIDSEFAYRHGDILAALYIVLVGDIAASIIEYVIRCIRKLSAKSGKEYPCRMKWILVLSAAFSLGILVYGIVNTSTVREKKHIWTAEGLAREHTFAFTADLHVGSAQSMDALREFCRQVNSEDPEFVILGGDITDEMTSYDDMVTAYSILSEIKAPVYFIYGNHDRQLNADFVGGRTYRDEQLAAAIQNAGIRILSDEYVKVADDLILLGREDISAGDARKDWQSLDNPYEGTGALVVADHQPCDKEQLAVERSALQLSGHTHAGQVWPLQLVYRILGLPAYGEFDEPGTRLYVTAGEGAWMMPLRTEAHCEWELITLTKPGAE